ncbi:MAG TPA: erythromycin esterase family protein [Tepidisphaeraceae bacterium]|jgi:erythromycin esterase-like protein
MKATQINDVDLIRQAALPFSSDDHYQPLLDAIGNARFVLLGEASHGTHEFYAIRNRLTQRLIAEKGFTAVVVEADWPDAWRVNRYVRGFDDDVDGDAALSGFRRFPQWMWRNTDVVDFVTWLRRHNESVAPQQPKSGFYGMDLYSLHGSIRAVVDYLEKIDPAAAGRARYRYGCFEDFGEDPQAYGYAAGFDMDRSCEDKVVEQLSELRRRAGDYANRDGRVAEDEYFFAEQNARLVINAEQYYRAMFDRRVNTWNLRDTHMVDTLDALTAYLDRHVGPTRVVVWAHNSHLGDARATDTGEQGQLNVGQLVRERWPKESFSVGFTTHDGVVTAASDWDAPAERKRVRPSIPDSYERLFHDAGLARLLLLLRDPTLRSLLSTPRLERAIGVIYRPETERWSHYFHARLAEQFDAVIHIDRTTAVRPLERVATWKSEEPDETLPSGL